MGIGIAKTDVYQETLDLFSLSNKVLVRNFIVLHSKFVRYISCVFNC